MTATSLYSSQCLLGESPLWHARRNCFYWVDINDGNLFSLDWNTKVVSEKHFNADLSLVVETIGDDLILALGTSIVRFNPDTEALSYLVDLEPENKDHRCNDGAVDSKGRLWVGTTHVDHDVERGVLYSIEKSNKPQQKIPRVTISNGIVWSLDNKRMYFIDSPTQRVDAYFFNKHTGEIIFDNTVINIPIQMGTPDGMTIDAEGMLWIAHWGGFGVYRWNPFTGKLLDKIEVPAPNVTSCRFAGEKLDQLVITTARKNMDDAMLTNYPESGNLFIANVEINGLEGFRFII
jgi:sugar lactone lactonase YvrE